MLLLLLVVAATAAPLPFPATDTHTHLTNVTKFKYQRNWVKKSYSLNNYTHDTAKVCVYAVEGFAFVFRTLSGLRSQYDRALAGIV